MSGKKLLGISVIIFLMISSCEKEKSEDVDELNDLALVTGINVVDEDGFLQGTYGNPNDTYRKYIDDNNDGYIGGGTYNYTFYPNPVIDVLNIFTSDKIQSLWVVKGDVSTRYQDFGFSDYFNAEVIDTFGISEYSLLEFNDLNVTGGLQLDLLNTIDDGIYKIFIRTENASLLWFSIIKSKENIETIEEKYFPW